MKEIVSEYKWECYKKIALLGTKGNLWKVEHAVTGEHLTMRKEPAYMQPVYEKIASIHHTGIVEVKDVFLYQGYLYVIEEYLEWELLSDVIAGRRLSKRRVFSIGRQLLDALTSLHGHAVVHRDIKPENIMMDADGHVKLIDFGIARLYTGGKDSDTAAKGSRGYAPPEQFGFGETDSRADIYALGVTLNELAAGELPENKMCGGKLGIVIRRCTQFDPKRRYQSAQQALQHMGRLEKAVLLPVFAMALFLVIAAIRAAMSLGKPQEISFKPAAYEDRVISVPGGGQYPAYLMAQDQEYAFKADFAGSSAATVYAEKEKAGLFLSCKLADGRDAKFRFSDVFAQVYRQQGYSSDTELERMVPEYELLFHDIDKDGAVDLLVTLAWRRRIDTPDPKNRYYLTGYSTLWVVYMAQNGQLACSEPLYFNDGTPTIEENGLIFDYEDVMWYGFSEGTWEAWD